MNRLIAVALCLLLSSSSFAWNNFGHMAVGWVAYQHLNPNTKLAVNKLIAKNPSYSTWKSSLPSNLSTEDRDLYIFMLATTWPDQIKGDSSYHDDGTNGGNTPPADSSATTNLGYSDKARHKYWHFIDVAFSPDNTTLGLIPYPNVETETAVFRQTLSSNATLKLKSYDLVWILHLVGDIHQPLHATSRFTSTQPTGDSGGNAVKFCATTDQPCSGNLHSFWDNLLGPSSGTPQQAAAVAAALPPVTVSSDDLDVHTWIDESFALAQSTAYANPPVGVGAGPFRYDQAYADNALAVAQKRVVQAGLRLANILNTEVQ
jgi:hypothetical protein